MSSELKSSLSDWLDHINTLHAQHIDLGLERILPIAKQLELTTFNFPVITITGTNGKGSCVSFLENIYQHAGYRVGAYTSPHLLKFNERIRVNQIEISDEKLLAAFVEIENARGSQALSFFEFTTLAALYFFKNENLDVLILEVGLGGRLDAVNVVDSDIAVVTTVDHDHHDWLGNTRESIGYEKAGIFRELKTVVCGDPQPPASMITIAKELKTEWLVWQQQFHYHLVGNSWHWFSPQKQYLKLPLPKLKLQNASTSLMAIELLQHRLPVVRSAIENGLQTAVLPGRFEKIIMGEVTFILDVAHNPQSARWLAKQLKQWHGLGPTLAVVAMLKDKIIDETLAPILPMVDEWFVAGLAGERGDNGGQIAAYLRGQEVKNWYNSATVIEALSCAWRRCRGLGRVTIVVFGSFHTVAAAKQFLQAYGREAK